MSIIADIIWLAVYFAFISTIGLLGYIVMIAEYFVAPFKTKTTMKKILAIAIVAIGCSGCSAMKDMAPNSWNVTYYEPTTGDRSGQTIAVGVSGALPFGKQ